MKKGDMPGGVGATGGAHSTARGERSATAGTNASRGRRQDVLGNRLLDALPLAHWRRISALLQRERAELKQILHAPGARIEAVYFPVDAVVSILTTLSDGAGVEIATVGNEGMLGSPVVLGSNAMPAREFCQVQVPGELLRMEKTAFAEVLSQDDSFREVVQLYVQALFSQVAQQVACNALHSVEERCCRWLLLTHDRVHSDSFPLSQEFLAQMLGVRRASVTLAAGALQTAKLIHYQRGEMTIVDRKGLEQVSCECYGALRDEFDRLLSSPRTTQRGRIPSVAKHKSPGTVKKRGAISRTKS